MKLSTRYFLIALTFLILALILRYWLGPLSERLPSNYYNEAALSEVNKFRSSPAGEFQESTLNTLRVDQVITNFGQVAIIEGALHIYYTSGAVNFEVTSLYGIDRKTLLNMPDYGEVNRSGQYLFPTHVEKIGYPIWDPMYVGQRQATFDHTENLDGLQVFVLIFIGSAMDETAGYSYLADVPEHYSVQTDGKGTIWVEPISGIVVDYEDSGDSYFVDPANGVRISTFGQKNTPQKQ